MRRNKELMGTGVSIDVPGLDDETVLSKAFAVIAQIDRRYSTYKKNSEVARFQRGELTEVELSRQFKDVMRRCIELEKQTDGYFSAWFSGHFDPTGYVKAMAIDHAAKVIRKAGFGTYCVAIGGDLIAASDSEKVWNIGIENPLESNAIVGQISAKNIAMATSGNYKRGEHIMNPKTHRPAKELLSVTVLGPDIVLADVLATAGFVMGKRSIDFFKKHEGYEALIINKKAELIMTAGLEELFGQLKMNF